MKTDESQLQPSSPVAQNSAGWGEILAWASYDVANASYATVVVTAVYNAYFVKTMVPQQEGHGFGTMLLTLNIAVACAAIVLTAPLLGTIADITASKKRLLMISTLCCILATGLLSAVAPGNWPLAMTLLVIANFTFGTGEDLIASFLPELVPRAKMGRISALGWGAGYLGGLLSLGAATAYVVWSQKQGILATIYVPQIVLGCAVVFAVLCTPTQLWLRERAQPELGVRPSDYLRLTWARLRKTFKHTLYYRDLFNILIAIFIYSCGTGTITHLASVYAQETLKFTPRELLEMILVVDVTAAVGVFAFGFIQDSIGSVRTLTISLVIWTVAVVLASSATTKSSLWIAANVIGIAMGATGSAGRALVGRFSPQGRSGEFLGLWGLAMKAATCVGVLVFGGVSYLTGGDLRLAMLALLPFFIGGILLVRRVDEDRGVAAAEHEAPND
jgi:MFS transporter, UMF1 family